MGEDETLYSVRRLSQQKGMMIYPYIYPTVVIALVLLVLAFIMLKYTKFGRSIYAIGGNEQSALMMGLNVRRVKTESLYPGRFPLRRRQRPVLSEYAGRLR